MKNLKIWQNALNRLKTGNANFANDSLNHKFQDSKRRIKMLHGQDPFAVILACSDSRVVPEIIFDTGIGELFVIRVAGNIANTSSIASIEYAVAHLNVKLIIVLGHQNCGAVTAVLDQGDHGKNLEHLLNFIQPAIFASARKEVDTISLVHAKLTAEQLMNQSIIIAKTIDSASLKIIPAYYNLNTGKVDFIE